MPKYKELNTGGMPKPIGAYSNGLVVPVGDKELILLTGQVATDADGRVVHKDDAAGQTEYIFENIRGLLGEAGAGIEDIIRVVIYLTDMDDFELVSPIRNKYLKDARPVSTMVEINRTAVDGCKVEIVVTAIK